MSEEEKIPLDGSQGETEGQPVNEVAGDNTEEIHITSEPGIAQQAEVTIQKSENENMEVHHPHHITHKKKWHEYLIEFLMLFLAVFLGFVAENKREHGVEADRAKEFATLLLTDLRNDSAFVSGITSAKETKVKHADSLMSILNSDSFANNNYRVVYHFRYVSSLTDFKPAFPVNFDQIKNSGSLRYYKNKELVSELSSLNRHLATTSEVFEKHNEFVLQHLTPFALQHFDTQQSDVFSGNIKVNNPDIFDWNKREAILLANKVNLTKTYDFFIMSFLNISREKINHLIALIRNEYDLK